jgi:hypothetical protein
MKCRAKTNKDQVLSRWKEHFEQHLNEREERDQPPDQVDLRIMELKTICQVVKESKAR